MLPEELSNLKIEELQDLLNNTDALISLCDKQPKLEAQRLDLLKSNSKIQLLNEQLTKKIDLMTRYESAYSQAAEQLDRKMDEWSKVSSRLNTELRDYTPEGVMAICDSEIQSIKTSIDDLERQITRRECEDYDDACEKYLYLQRQKTTLEILKTNLNA